MRPLRLKPLWLAALAFLCGLHVWLATAHGGRTGLTVDELLHVTAGYSYWSEGDYRLHPENGLLPQRLAALPLVLSSEFHMPALIGDARSAGSWRLGDPNSLGREFLFNSGNDLTDLLARARFMIALLGALTVALVGVWARDLFSPSIGLFCAALAATSPSLLAHAGLATSDAAGTLGFVAATLAWWRLCHRVTPMRIAIAGTALGLFALCKYSAAVFAPIGALLVLLRLLRPTPLGIRAPTRPALNARGLHRVAPLAASCMAALLISWATIWAAYGFRYDTVNPRHTDRFSFPWSATLIEKPHMSGNLMADGAVMDPLVAMTPGIVQRAVAFAAQHRLLPEAWLYGLAYVDTSARFRSAFLAGEWATTGWWWFFPLAFLVKSTPAELLAFAAASACWFLLLRGGPGDRRLAYKLSGPLAAGLVFTTFAITSSLNIGHRHILPLYGLAFVFAGLIPRLLKDRLRPALTRSVLATLLAVQVGAAAIQRPHYLAYFNPFSGGPDQGYRLLVDSSLDWGQGLPDLADWLRQNAAGRRVFLNYFGVDDPARLGIKATRFGDVTLEADDTASASSPPYLPGLYIFSATHWQRVYTLVRGPWRPGYERAYWELHRFWLASPPPELDGFTRKTAPLAEARQRLLRYENLRFGRLRHYLRDREPDAIVAHSLLIFNLADTDLRAALFGTLDEPTAPNASPR
jgi:hypothetical protein